MGEEPRVASGFCIWRRRTAVSEWPFPHIRRSHPCLFRGFRNSFDLGNARTHGQRPRHANGTYIPPDKHSKTPNFLPRKWIRVFLTIFAHQLGRACSRFPLDCSPTFFITCLHSLMSCSGSLGANRPNLASPGTIPSFQLPLSFFPLLQLPRLFRVDLNFLDRKSHSFRILSFSTWRLHTHSTRVRSGKHPLPGRHPSFTQHLFATPPSPRPTRTAYHGASFRYVGGTTSPPGDHQR